MHYIPRLTAECLTQVFPEPSPGSSPASLYLYIKGDGVVMKKCTIPSLFHTDDPGMYGLPVLRRNIPWLLREISLFYRGIPEDTPLPDITGVFRSQGSVRASP